MFFQKQWNKFSLYFNIWENKNPLSCKLTLSWRMIEGSPASLTFFLYLLTKIVILYHWLAWWTLSNRTDKKLVFSFSLHWKHHLNLLYLLILISTLTLYCFMILHVIEIGQWIFSGEKKLKGGITSQPSHVTPAIFRLQGKKTLKKRRMLQWLA